MKNKGFTLIELLAVIVILAVIVLMITPRILQIIEKSKKNTFETTANSLLRTTKQFYANAIVNQDNKVYEFSFEEGKKGETVDGDKLELSGTLPTEGRIVLSPNGKIDIRVSNDEYSACKGYDDYAVVVLTKAEGFLCGVNEDGSTSNNPITEGQIAALEEKINQIESNQISKNYPVGSIYISTSSDNPGGGENPIFPDTTWEAYGQGRTLIGVGTGTDSNGTTRTFNAIDPPGGAYTHTLTTTQIPSHTHIQNAHTHLQNAHNHTQNPHGHSTYINTNSILAGSPGGTTIAVTFDGTGGTTQTTATNNASTATNQNTTATNQNTGGGEAHNNIQPYIAVYMWKRTN